MHQGVTPTFATSHPLHHPKPPRRQRQAVPADGRVFAGRVHRTPDGAAVSLGQAVPTILNERMHRIERFREAFGL